MAIVVSLCGDSKVAVLSLERSKHKTLATGGNESARSATMPVYDSAGIHRALGSGIMRAIIGTDPVAGSDFVETVPAGVQWRIVSIYATFVTDATVIGRRVKLAMDGGALPDFYRSEANGSLPGTGQPANITDVYIWAITGRTSIVATPIGPPLTFDLLIPLANAIILGPGMRFKSETLNIQAGDNWGAPSFLVEEWPV